MPGSDIKDIYIAKSVSELNKLAENINHATNARMWVLVYTSRLSGLTVRNW